MIPVRFLKLHPDAVIPHYAHGPENDAGMDLVAIEAATVSPQNYRATMIRTGLAVELPRGYEAQIRPRSGLACKYLVTLANSPGTIDPGYRGEILIGLVTHSQMPYHVSRGERIAQLVISQYAQCEVIEAHSLSDSVRGEKGFGSTGS